MFLILWVTDTQISNIVKSEYLRERKNVIIEDEKIFYCMMGKHTVYQLRWTKKTLAWLEKLRIEANKPDDQGNIDQMRFTVYEARQFQFDFPEDVKKVGEAMAFSQGKGANFNINLKKYCENNDLDYESELLKWIQIM